MHHGVWISANRRCEVGVVFKRQTKVADVMNGIFRLHHGSQRHALNHLLFWASFCFVHQLVEASCRSSLCAVGLYSVAKLSDKLSECFQLLWVWIVVYTIRQRLSLLALSHLAHALCHRAVSQQHKLLNQLVGILRALIVAAYRLALVVNIKVKFLGVKLHGTILKSCCTQLLSQRIKLYQQFCILALIWMCGCSWWCRLACSVYHTIIFQQLLHLFVGVSSVALYHGMLYTVASHIGIFVEIEDYAISQFLFVWSQ